MQTQDQQYSPDDYFLAATEQMSNSAPMQAFSICVVGLEQYPQEPKLLCLAARACIALDRLREARLYLEKARENNVGMSMVHETWADLLLLESQPGEAVKSYRQAVRLDPSREQGIQAKIDRARVMMSSNRPQRGKRREIMGFAPEMARAGQLERDGEPGKAEDIYRDILRRDPEHVEAMRMLAAVAVRHRQYRDAEIFLQRATSIAPDYARAWLELAGTQMEQEKLDDAIASSRRVVELTPDIAESHIALANALARTDRAEEALDAYRRALEIAPAHPGAFSGVGQQLKTLGRQEEAIAVHRENMLRNPQNAEPYWSLANMKTFDFTDRDIANMETQLLREDLDELSEVQLSNSLGLALERRRDYDRAFSYFQRGNDKRREAEIYDPVETQVSTDRIIEVFTEAFLHKHRGHGEPDPAPIFIIGLPRSGSTLIEQILASHSQVEGTHELSDLAQVVRTIPKMNRNDRFPENLKGLKSHLWSQFGRCQQGDFPLPVP